MLAILLALILSGIVEGLKRLRIPRAVSATLLLVLGGVALGGALDALWTPACNSGSKTPRTCCG